MEAWGNLASNDYKFARLPLELSLHYLVKRKNRVFKHIEASIWNVWRCNLQNFGLQILIPSRAVRTTSQQANWFYLLHRWKSLHCCSTDERSKWSRLRTASDKEAWRQLSDFLRTRSTFIVGFITVACLNAKCGQFLFFKTVCDHCLNKVMILLIYWYEQSI